MYTCGVTVYDDCHIGHGRSLYVFEIIRRYLKYKGFKVKLVRNITDVDDKIIDKARQRSKEKNIPLKDAFNQVRKTYIDSYRKDLKLLNIPEADKEPLATENISEMIEYIKGLINKEFAYEAEGNVYFEVRKSKDYGKLSGKKIDDLLESVRIDSDPFKKDSLDFALWKKAKDDEPFWDSPWGKGRPGWHIECSVMSQKYLKTETLDIHGGGRDLVFPHHENEIAQSEALTGKTFANYWIHHGLLTINKKKMAKSLGNFISIKEIEDKGYPLDALKLLFLQTHYSHPVDFSWKAMNSEREALRRIADFLERVEKEQPVKAGWGEIPYPEFLGKVQETQSNFEKCMDDDFHTPNAVAVIFDLVRSGNAVLRHTGYNSKKHLPDLKKAKRIILELGNILGLSLEGQTAKKDRELETYVKSRIKERAEARKNKNFGLADRIRKDLEAKGIILEDTKEGTEWCRKV